MAVLYRDLALPGQVGLLNHLSFPTINKTEKEFSLVKIILVVHILVFIILATIVKLKNQSFWVVVVL
jgi:hypothetical protein